MAIADDIRSLRERALGDLNEAWEYYEDTKLVWLTVRKLGKSGRVIGVFRFNEGTRVRREDLPEKARGYIARQLSEATFLQFLSFFEAFFFDLLGSWLAAYPQSLGGKTLNFKAVLDAPDKEAITRGVISQAVFEVSYKKPAEWFAYLDERVKLGCPSADEIGRIAEAKASRDVLIHGRGIVNRIYAEKSGDFARHQVGERLVISESYHRATWELICKLVDELSDAAIAKAP